VNYLGVMNLAEVLRKEIMRSGRAKNPDLDLEREREIATVGEHRDPALTTESVIVETKMMIGVGSPIDLMPIEIIT
jgi:hypothetical protein